MGDGPEAMSENSDELDQVFMNKALRLAARGLGQTSPNPMVGAVVVKSNEMVGRGYHEVVGGPHAEVNALRAAGDKAKNGTLYVTLEPCNHQGRTPPCTLAVLGAGISRVVVGMSDPNPRVEGGGALFLRKHGLAVDVGILETKCRLLNQSFIKHSITGLPYVTIKAAATLDGCIAGRTGDSKWITNEQSRRFVHQLRCAVDSILVGIDTAIADDPQLTARIKRSCRQPIRIILDTRLRIPMTGRLISTAREVPVWVACGEQADRDKEMELQDVGVAVIRLPLKDGRVDLSSLLEEMGKRQVTSLLVEGGGKVSGAFIDRQLADDFHFFYAPKILGDGQATRMVNGRSSESMSDMLQVHDVRVRRFGQDVLLSGRFSDRIY
jgi:diaminohydroxyphosphoribosylaminopyrimidine deaminase / 5-amino-6-(5-phosphoribosylamino)uracil reductase